MKFFAILASAVSAIDIGSLMLMQAAQQGNNGMGGINPILFASMMDKDSDNKIDPITLMALSGGNMGGDMSGLLALSLFDKTTGSDDSFSSMMALQAMNGGELPKLSYWNKRK